jgi:hypothetical protein
MQLKSFVTEVFQSIDQVDSAKFASFITPNGSFRFANNPAVKGNKAIEDYVEGFLQSLKGISHSNLESWTSENTVFVNGNVKYTRHNNTTLDVPFSCTWKMKGHAIDEYLIFVDSSQLYQ